MPCNICLSLSEFFPLAWCHEGTSMLIQMARLPSFLWLNNTLLYISTSLLYSFIHWHLLGDVSVSWLLWVMFQWMWECKYLFNIMFSFPLDVYPEMGLLDPVLILFFLGGNLHVFPSTYTNLHSHQQCIKGSLFSTSSPTFSGCVVWW